MGNGWSCAARSHCWPPAPAVQAAAARTGDPGAVESRRSGQRRRRARRSRAADRRAGRGLRVDVDGRDVTSARSSSAPMRRVVGLITALKDGRERRHCARRPRRRAAHDHESPDRRSDLLRAAGAAVGVRDSDGAAATDTSPATNASGLSTAATDAQCNDRERGSGCSIARPSSARSAAAARRASSLMTRTRPTPADLAETTNDQGVKVKYIVRVERGVMNRAIYDMAVLFDPGSAGARSAAGGLEPQAAVVVRRRQRYAVQAVRARTARGRSTTRSRAAISSPSARTPISSSTRTTSSRPKR